MFDLLECACRARHADLERWRAWLVATGQRDLLPAVESCLLWAWVREFDSSRPL